MGQGTTGAMVPTPAVMPPQQSIGQGLGSPLVPQRGGLGQGTFMQQHNMMHNQMDMTKQMPAPMTPMLASAGGVGAAVSQGPGMSGMQTLDMQANNYNPMATTNQIKPAGGAK